MRSNYSLYIFFAFIFSAFACFAQVGLSSAVPSVPLDVCTGSRVFTVTLAGGASASSGNSLSVVLPSGMHLLGNATYTTGATGSLVNTGSGTAPVFSVVNVPASGLVVISMNLQADCSTIGVTTNANTYNFVGSAGSADRKSVV